MLQTLSKSITGLSAAESLSDLNAAIASAACDAGFISFNITVNKRYAAEFMEDPLLTNWSRDDLIAYTRDGWAEGDPLLRRAVEAESPFLWSADEWREKGYSDYFEYLRLNGIRGGATIPLGNKPGQLGAMTLLSASANPLTANTLHAVNVLARFSLARVQVLSEGTDLRNRDPDPLHALSTRQVEILHWVAEGKTNREIAVIMESTLSTINYHLEQIRHKLGVPNRTSAAALYKGFGAPRR
ncbi:LuxR family transcriptional regulator [Roseovarius sp. MMSF_3281]|uniref:helix-turn-helix transcriptional regulator n=1 Tax=Roseovarius sp. MMSF_3281 TaxID=3046694 RepID=UPI00273F7D62|nr:LuxR family transcriptional regulator [Roseovarius sp. MMSF_3281]